jgi:hypothetical protein
MFWSCGGAQMMCKPPVCLRPCSTASAWHMPCLVCCDHLHCTTARTTGLPFEALNTPHPFTMPRSFVGFPPSHGRLPLPLLLALCRRRLPPCAGQVVQRQVRQQHRGVMLGWEGCMSRLPVAADAASAAAAS